MASRYSKYRIINNGFSGYEFLRKERGIKNIRQYETPYLYNPTAAERGTLQTTNHIWKYGDRYYNLAHKHYGKPEYWWVIAWYNGYPTEADIRPSDYIEIPLNLEKALMILGVY